MAEFRLRTGLAAAAIGGGLLVAGCTSAPDTPARLEVFGVSCPDMQIRSGDQAHTVYDRNDTTDAARVRYQASILLISRVCFRTEDVITIEVRVAGRIVAGPRGTGGTGSAVLQLSVLHRDGAVLDQREYTVAANIGAPLYGGDYAVNDTFAIPTSLAQTTRIVVGFID